MHSAATERTNRYQCSNPRHQMAQLASSRRTHPQLLLIQPLPQNLDILLVEKGVS